MKGIRPRPPQELLENAAPVYRDMTPEEVAEMRALIKAPFHPNLVDWRPGSFAKKEVIGNREVFYNQAWSYVDPREVTERLDEVVGFGYWASEIRIQHVSVMCDLSILFPWGWVTRTDGTHIGDVEIDVSQKNTKDRRSMIEFEKEVNNIVNDTKGSYSIAFKRAASKWGVAAYLYDLPKLERPTNDKKFYPWARIEMWLVAASVYEEWWEKRVIEGKAEATKRWGPELKAADFAVWCRMMGYDLSEIEHPDGRRVFPEYNNLVEFCKRRRMDPERVPYARKTRTQPVSADAPTYPTPPATSTPSTDAAPTPAPAQPAAPSATTVTTTKPPSTQPAQAAQPAVSDTAAPVGTVQTAPPSEEPRTSPLSSTNVDQFLPAVKTEQDLVAFVESIENLHKAQMETTERASFMFDRLYARLGEVIKNQYLTREAAGEFYKKTYYPARKRVDPNWQPPQPQRAK